MRIYCLSTLEGAHLYGKRKALIVFVVCSPKATGGWFAAHSEGAFAASSASGVASSAEAHRFSAGISPRFSFCRIILEKSPRFQFGTGNKVGAKCKKAGGIRKSHRLFMIRDFGTVTRLSPRFPSAMPFATLASGWTLAVCRRCYPNENPQCAC